MWESVDPCAKDTHTAPFALSHPQAFKLSTGDSLDGKTSRDLAACTLVDALGRDVEVI